MLLIFVTAAGVAPVIPFNQAAMEHPELVLPGEFFVGLLLGMGIRIAFAVLHFAGQLVGFSMGFSAVQAIDPQTQNRSSLMSGYFTLIGFCSVSGRRSTPRILSGDAVQLREFSDRWRSGSRGLV